MELVRPSEHTPGGFRLDTDADIERLLLVKTTEPLDRIRGAVRTHRSGSRR